MIASLFYTYYERSDVADKTSRPLALSFNGGPGSASLWMHIGYTGPVALNIDDEGYPLQPYGVKPNPHSILDVCDIVYIDPVNTGFSRILDPSVDRKVFFGVNADIKYLAGWLDTFVSRLDRWTSPKYIIGESYGTTRVSGLALELQQSHYMFLNGVVLVSPTELGIKRDGPVNDASYLPYYCATAWYHGKLGPELQAKDLETILPEVEQFTSTSRAACFVVLFLYLSSFRNRYTDTYNRVGIDTFVDLDWVQYSSCCLCWLRGDLSTLIFALPPQAKWRRILAVRYLVKREASDHVVATILAHCWFTTHLVNGVPVSSRVILQHNLAVPPSFFWKELLRDQGFTVGRLDSRYKGMDSEDAGERPDYNAELAAWK